MQFLTAQIGFNSVRHFNKTEWYKVYLRHLKNKPWYESKLESIATIYFTNGMVSSFDFFEKQLVEDGTYG